MRVLVTGATGLIGRRLVERLLERGDTVSILAREPLRALPLRKRGVRVLGGDIIVPRTLPHALAQVEVVYHAAALVQLGIPQPALHQTNVVGTANMLAAAQAAGTERFVLVSSVAAYTRPSGATTEDAPVGPGHRRGTYSASKARADMLASAAMGQGSLTVSIVRPVVVYDNGQRPTDARTWVRRLRRLPIVGLPHGGSQAFDIVHADDVAALLILCGTLPQAANRAFNASGDEGLRLRDLLRDEAGRGPMILTLPWANDPAATFPARRARTELGFLPTHSWFGDTPSSLTTPQGPTE